jgi:HdeA/HdeB family
VTDSPVTMSRRKRSALAASWLAVGAVVVLAVSAFAQISLTPRIIHVDKLTCAELLSLPREANDRLLIFFDGFISGMRQRMVWDERAEGEMIERAVGYCKADPSGTVLSAFMRAAGP